MRIPPVPGKTADYKPESGKTWDTFGPAPAMKPPQGISLEPKKPAPKPKSS